MNVMAKFDSDFREGKDENAKVPRQPSEQFYSFPNNEGEKSVEPMMKESSVISKNRESVMSEEQPEKKRESVNSGEERRNSKDSGEEGQNNER